MMKKTNILLSVLLCVLIGFNLSSCSKDSTTSYTYSVRLTDAPGPFSAVYIDLQGVEVTGSDGKAVTMNIHPGTINLLNFSNGVDTLIASGSLEIATVAQIRLILGTNNYVMINSVKYPLSTPSADQTGLKLQVHQTLQAGVGYSVVLDFDANKSIVLQGNGTYSLKPVIRTVEAAINGSIQGKITPIGTLAIVTATSADLSLSFSSNVNVAGNFMIMGLPAGTYTVTVTPTLPLLPVIRSGVAVTTGASTNVGLLAL
jgi:hypothetical protein